MRKWAAILILFAPSMVLGQSSSAADVYRIAAGAVPAVPASPEGSEPPLDDAARDVLRQGERALELFDAASAMHFGDWGLDPTDPMYAGRVIKELPALADLVILRARASAQWGELEKALDDCRRIALLSRRLSIQPSLMRQAQQNALMQKALAMAAAILPELSPAQAVQFAASLHDLPPPASATEVARVEQESYLRLYTQLIENDDVRRMTSRVSGTLVEIFGISTQPINVDDLARDPDLAELALSQSRELSDKLIKLLTAPDNERSAAMRIIPSNSDFVHPLSRGAAELMLQVYRQSERHEMMMAMFDAATRVYSDPIRPFDLSKVDEKVRPFDIRPSAGGFDLYGKAADDPEPLVLRVGRRSEARLVPTTQP